MSGKLNQSLDEILATQRRNSGNRRSTRRTSAGKPAPVAPAGGIQKSTKPARNAGKASPANRPGLVGESKIMVSNLVSRPAVASRRLPDVKTTCANSVTAQGCF